MSGVPVSLTIYNSLADPDLQINRGGAGEGGEWRAGRSHGSATATLVTR